MAVVWLRSGRVATVSLRPATRASSLDSLRIVPAEREVRSVTWIGLELIAEAIRMGELSERKSVGGRIKCQRLTHLKNGRMGGGRERV